MQTLRQLVSVEVWVNWLQHGLRALTVVVLAWLVAKLARRLLGNLRDYALRVMDRRGEVSAMDLERRSTTIVTVLAKLASTLIWLVATVMVLTELNFHIEPLLAGLGVAGLALGLGAQTLIKDWMAGLFLLLEDQIRMGDAVSINGTGGKVEEINLRTIVLRAENGAVHIIPNGSIQSLANLTREYSYYVFEATLAHGADAALALRVLEEAGAEVFADERFRVNILAPLEVFGVDRLSERGAVIRARFKTLPSQQAAVGRELNLRVKQKFDAAGVGFPQVSVS